ncbi:hypothetical protein [Streptomyces sp. NPDC057257]|uniref:hypothetical protein n=1 Tax=Streptomyces sp. NPDC057257 TaxID=3346071 RepID=UPI00362754E0
MEHGTDQATDQPTPVADDAHATVDQLLARATQDLGSAVTARIEREAQGGSGIREGILPGGDN